MKLKEYHVSVSYTKTVTRKIKARNGPNAIQELRRRVTAKPPKLEGIDFHTTSAEEIITITD